MFCCGNSRISAKSIFFWSLYLSIAHLVCCFRLSGRRWLMNGLSRPRHQSFNAEMIPGTRSLAADCHCIEHQKRPKTKKKNRKQNSFCSILGFFSENKVHKKLETFYIWPKIKTFVGRGVRSIEKTKNSAGTCWVYSNSSV